MSGMVACKGVGRFDWTGTRRNCCGGSSRVGWLDIGYIGPEILEGGRLKGAFENALLRLLIARNGPVFRED